MLFENFPQYSIHENYHPAWLISSNNTRLELDFYIDELKVAFEVQGEQHFRFDSLFHKAPGDFEKRKQYDQEKRDLCYGHGVQLIEIYSMMDAEIAIQNLKPNEKYLEYIHKPRTAERGTPARNAKKTSTLAYINKFCDKAKLSGMKVPQKTIDRVLEVANSITNPTELEAFALKELEWTLNHLKGIL